MDKRSNIHRVAEAMVRKHGADAYAYLRDQAHTAKLYGDRKSAMKLWEIALAALEILNDRTASTENASAQAAESRCDLGGR